MMIIIALYIIILFDVKSVLFLANKFDVKTLLFKQIKKLF